LNFKRFIIIFPRPLLDRHSFPIESGNSFVAFGTIEIFAFGQESFVKI